MVPDTSTAFVPLYATGHIAVLNLDAGTVTGDIDLTSFHDGSDADGGPDIASGVYVPPRALVYFALQRIDISKYPIVCPPVASLLVAIDPATKSVVDANGAKSGNATELGLVSPGDLSYDTNGGRIVFAVLLGAATCVCWATRRTAGCVAGTWEARLSNRWNRRCSRPSSGCLREALAGCEGRHGPKTTACRQRREQPFAAPLDAPRATRAAYAQVVGGAKVTRCSRERPC